MKISISLSLFACMVMGEGQQMNPCRIERDGVPLKSLFAQHIDTQITTPNSVNKAIPGPGFHDFRMVTFNAEAFYDLFGVSDITRQAVRSIVQDLDPTVIVLQNAPYGDKGRMERLKGSMKESEFSYSIQFANDEMALGPVIFGRVPLRHIPLSLFSTSTELGLPLVAGARLKTKNNVSHEIAIVNVALYGKDEGIRGRQIRELSSHIANLGQPAVLLGDFGTSTNSEDMGPIRQLGFRSAFEVLGWPSPQCTAFPGVNTDTAMVVPEEGEDPSVKTVGAYQYWLNNSSHTPIVVDIYSKDAYSDRKNQYFRITLAGYVLIASAGIFFFFLAGLGFYHASLLDDDIGL